MIAAFRCDASLEMGTGHVMRCLTLAQVLKASGVQCHFICREHRGNLIEFIQSKGFVVHALPIGNMGSPNMPVLAHADWLGAAQTDDASACRTILQELNASYLVADHYGLDIRWERAMRGLCKRLLVIDDLADRPHDCDVLLDQTLGRSPHEYDGLLPIYALRLCGADHALLRNEFRTWRSVSLQRRTTPATLNRLLVTLGGVDKDNFTVKVLDALLHSRIPPACVITVVMGTSAPWTDQVKDKAANMPWHTEVLVNVDNMAELMASCDAAIGAAGSTSWERCCLGLPTFMLVLAENQRRIAQELVWAGAATLIELDGPIDMSDLHRLATMSAAAMRLVDGLGAERVAKAFVPELFHLDSFS